MKTLFKYFLIIIFYFTSILSVQLSAQENLKIGLLIPMTGENEKIGQLIIKAVKLAINDIDNNNIEIIPKDSGSDPKITLKLKKCEKNFKTWEFKTRNKNISRKLTSALHYHVSSPAKLGRDSCQTIKKKVVTRLQKASRPEIDDRVEMPQNE